MTYSKSLVNLFSINVVLNFNSCCIKVSLFQKSKFDLQLEEWGFDIGVLEDTAIMRNFIALTKECEKKKHKKIDAALLSARFMIQMEIINAIIVVFLLCFTLTSKLRVVGNIVYFLNL